MLHIYFGIALFTALWCAIGSFYYDYNSTEPKKLFWIRLPVVMLSGLIFPLTWVVIISRHFQAKESFNNNIFRRAMEWIALKLFGRLFK